MTAVETEDAKPTPPAAEPDKTDVHLSTLLSVILGLDDEKDENSFGLTLVTTGGTFSGLAHTRSAWAKAQVDGLEEAGGAGRELAAAVLRQVDTLFKESTDEDGESPTRRGYINLKDAKDLDNNIQYPWLRISMEHIVAWNLGTVSTGNV